ncbi:MAG: hypothetical protein AB1704_42100 [Pseudomonadota bacterium]
MTLLNIRFGNEVCHTGYPTDPMLKLVDTLTQTTRDVSVLLRPTMLEMCLIPALKRLTETLRKR